MSYLEELFGLTGKVALVTGGGRGIGQVVARGLAKAGAEVAIVCRSGAEETLSLIAGDGGKAFYSAADVTREEAVDRAVAQILSRCGRRAVVFNNAGSIVNTPQWQCSYNASKAGVIHLTRSLAAEWADYGIRVNSLSPGYIATPMSVDTPQELKDAWMPLIPMHRMGKPEELVPAVLYLASDASGYTSGSDVLVDGAYCCL